MLKVKKLYSYLVTQSFIPVSAEFVPTDRATYDRFRRELLDGRYDVVHYAGHGWFDAESPGVANSISGQKKNDKVELFR